MQQHDHSRPRRWPLILLALAILMAALWSGGWYYAAGRAESVIAGWREREAKAGRIHTCGAQSIGGFPFRFEMRCADPGLEVKTAQPPLSVKAKEVLVTASVLQPTLLTSTFIGPLTVAEAGQAVGIVAT